MDKLINTSYNYKRNPKKKHYLLSEFMTGTTIQLFGQHRHQPVNSFGVSPIMVLLIIVIVFLPFDFLHC